MKRCCLCDRFRPLDEFNVRRRSADGKQNVCRECNRRQSRKYYETHRTAHRAVTRARKSEQRARMIGLVAEYLSCNACVDCGERDLRVLDFDHRDSTLKTAEVMWLVQNGYSERRIRAEIAHCDVRCRNCHARITYDRMGANWRTVFAERMAAATARTGEGRTDRG